MKNLGEVLKKCRKIKGLTQAEVCRLTKISESHLSLIEKNKREPSLTVLESISNTLAVPTSIIIFLASQERVEELSEEQINNLTTTIYKLIS